MRGMPGNRRAVVVRVVCSSAPGTPLSMDSAWSHGIHARYPMGEYAQGGSMVGELTLEIGIGSELR